MEAYPEVANPVPIATHMLPSRNGKVVIVDDDARIRELLQRYLAQAGYTVLAAENAAALTNLLAYEIVDVIVLDLMMPGEDGLSVCRRLRKSRNKTPIIMLTAKDEDIDRIHGLELGADDYLGKPFNPRELLARIHAVLRRRPMRETPGGPAGDGDEQVSFGPFIFDMATRALSRDGQVLQLSTGEFAMLKALVRHPRQPLAREKLAKLTRGSALGQYGRGLDVQMSRLRKLIEVDPANPRYLQTVWGVGYVFVPDGMPHLA
jgi:two-component system phosphate regulon response regulator OmpR